MIAREIKFGQLKYVKMFVVMRTMLFIAATFYMCHQIALDQTAKESPTMLLIALVAMALAGVSTAALMEIRNRTLFLSNGTSKLAIKEIQEKVDNMYRPSIAAYRKIGPFWFRIALKHAVYTDSKFSNINIYSYTPSEWWVKLN